MRLSVAMEIIFSCLVLLLLWHVRGRNADKAAIAAPSVTGNATLQLLSDM